MARTRGQLEQAAAEFEQWAANLDLDDPNVTVEDSVDLRSIGQALTARVRDERAVAEAVAAARANGRSWGMIGLVLGVSKQAAQKRYGNVPLPEPSPNPVITPAPRSRTDGRFEVYEDRAGKFRFRLKTSEGQVVAVGEAYESKDAALRGCEAVRRAVEGASLVEC